MILLARFSRLLSLSSLLAGSAVLHAQTQQDWVGNSSTNLLDAANWSPASVPVATNNWIFGAAGSAGTSLSIGSNLSLGRTITPSQLPALDFSVGAAAYTFGGAGQITIATGGLRNQSGQTQTFNNPFRFNTGSGHTLSNANSAFIFSNTVTVTSATTTFFMGSATGQSVTFGGNVVDASTRSFVFNGGGSASVASFNGSANTALGNLTIGQNVRVNIGSASGLASTGTVTMNAAGATLANTSGSALSTGASLAFNATSQNFNFGDASHTSANNISFTGTAAINADQTRSLTISGTGVTVSSASVWNNTVTGTRSLNVNGAGNTLSIGGFAIGASGETANTRLNIGGNGNVTVTGGVTNGLGTGNRDLQYNGAGTMLISGSSSYNGTTGIGSTGVFLVNGTHTGGLNYSVAGVLGGTGTIDLSANNASVSFVSTGEGRLQAGSANGLTIIGGASSALTLNNSIDTESGRLLFTLNAPSTTAVEVQGLLTIGGGFLDFGDFAFTAGSGFGVGTYNLFDYTTLSGSLGSSLTGTIGGLDATISLDSANSAIILTVVPEPGTAGLLTAAGLVVLVFRRRRSAF
jgi:hypothetical protein